MPPWIRSAALAALLGASACGAGTGERATAADPTAPRTSRRAQRGYASWYGGKFHGRRTASGERFDKRRLTAAHRTLPFGTRVRVTNLANGRVVIVQINDRGPFGGRGGIIDLSEAAARRIGMIASGRVRVTVEVLE
jgi:rare lipoprotein A